jgi:tetratricopeptide (TPR) repeat protein
MPGVAELGLPIPNVSQIVPRPSDTTHPLHLPWNMNIWNLLPTIALLALPLAAWADDTNAVTTPAPIPEAAREHFVMGSTLYSNATSVVDFKQAADEFQQAADLAPQWSKPRYNLAWAKEAAEDYAGAIADLKRYQQFNLPEAEARAVQDKIYVIKAKLAKAEMKKAEEQRLAEAKRAEQDHQQDALSVFVGEWTVKGGGGTLKVRRSSGGVFSMVVRNERIQRTINCYDIAPVENSLSFKQTNDGQETPFRAVVNSHGVLEFRVSLHDDGKFDTVVSEWLRQ